MRREEAKALKAEQKQASKEDKQKGKEVESRPTTATEGPKQQPSPQEPETKPSSTVGRVRALSISFAKRPARHHKNKDSIDATTASDDAPSSPTGKVRAWLLSRFPHRRTKSAAATPAAPATDSQQPPQDNDNDTNNGTAKPQKKGFIGGAALARLKNSDNTSTPSVAASDGKGKGKEREVVDGGDSSMREVALAGRSPPTTTTESSSTQQQQSGPPPPSTPPPPLTSERPLSEVSLASIPASASGLSAPRSVSSVSAGSSGSERYVAARSEPELSAGSLPSLAGLTPPRPLVGAGVGGGRGSPFRESRFSEILD